MSALVDRFLPRWPVRKSHTAPRTADAALTCGLVPRSLPQVHTALHGLLSVGPGAGKHVGLCGRRRRASCLSASPRARWGSPRSPPAGASDAETPLVDASLGRAARAQRACRSAAAKE